jgi:hypothetical protein
LTFVYESDEQRINRLARYNSEVAHGLVHTDEWRELMAREQEWFDQRERARMIEQGGKEVSSGIWHVPAPTRKHWYQRVWER